MNKNLRKIIKSLASLKLTVWCLSLLFVLTLWGTIAQVDGGLYYAQERFFNSFFFMIGGLIPFPGARLIIWILFINLICAAQTRLVYKWNQAGIIIIHLGLVFFFFSAFVIFHGSVESNLTLSEGSSSNVSSSYYDWELSVWTQQGQRKKVMALDTKTFQSQDSFFFPEYGLTFIVENYFPNCDAYRAVASPDQIQGVNDSGIKRLTPVEMNKEREKNYAGVILRVRGADNPDLKIILYGGETRPTRIQKEGKIYYAMLRRKRFELPFVLTLKDFRKEVHPNTQMARSYESLVEIEPYQGEKREVLISMNEPLRYKSFTLYQASYAIDQQGREFSTLAVVKNAGRLLPYISSLIVCVGMLLHLILMGVKKRKKHA